GFLVKPRFVLDGGELRVVGAPVSFDGPSLAALHSTPEASRLVTEHDAWYSEDYTTPKLWHHVRSLNVLATLFAYREKRVGRERLLRGEDPRGLELTVAIAKKFSDEARAAGVQPIILILPLLEAAMQPGFDPAAFPLTVALRKASLEVVDLTPAVAEALKTQSRDTLCFPNSHYRPVGHALLARALSRDLEPYVARALADRAATRTATRTAGGGEGPTTVE
ncbi:hypothetical protein L6R52_43430, partial [Myxococcota bacterium]|nr:hypothetical protein [Myxococcota bacterium]